MTLRKEIIKIARESPETRRYLIPLLRKDAMEFDTRKELLRYLQSHPGADKSKHRVKTPKKPHGSFQDFVSKVKGAKKAIIDAVTKAPEDVQRIFTEPEHRKKFLGGVASIIKKSPKAVAMQIMQATKHETHEIKHAVGAAKKLFKKPPGPFSKADKKALYAAGAYVAGAALAAAPPGGAMIAAVSALGHSFAMHVGIKSVHHLLDDGFLHYEWAHTLFQALHHASEKDEQGELTEGLVRVIADVVENLTDEDMEKILSGVDMPDGANDASDDD